VFFEERVQAFDLALGRVLVGRFDRSAFGVGVDRDRVVVALEAALRFLVTVGQAAFEARLRNTSGCRLVWSPRLDGGVAFASSVVDCLTIYRSSRARRARPLRSC
jgi:hypothetical protein